MRRLKRFIVAGIVLLAGVALGVYLLGPRLATGLVRGRIIAAVGRRVRGEVSVGRILLGWRTGIEIRNLRVTGPGSSDPDVTVASLRARPALGPLVSGTVVVRGFRMEGVEVRLARRGGRWNLADLVRGSDAAAAGGASAGEAPSARFGEGPIPPLTIDASLADVTLILEEPREGGAGGAGGGGGGAGGQERIEALRDLVLTMRPDEPARFRFIAAGGIEVTGTIDALAEGRVRPPKEIVSRIEVRARGYDLERLAPFLRPFARRVEGTLDIEERIGFKNGRIVGRGTVGADRLLLEGLGGDGAGALELETLRIESELALATGSRPGGPRPKGPRPGGTIRIEGGAGRISGIPGLAGPIPLTGSSFEGELTGPRSLRVRGLRVRTDSGEIRAKGDLALEGEVGEPRGMLEVRVRGDAGGLARLVSALPEVAGTLDTTVTVEAHPPGALALRGRARIDDFLAPGAHAAAAGRGEGLRLGSVRADFHAVLAGREVEVEALEVGAAGATVSLSGRMRLEGAGGGLPAGSLHLEARADLERLRKAAPRAFPGNLSGELRLAGEIESGDGLTFDLDLSGADLVGAEVRGRLEPGRAIRVEGQMDLALAPITEQWLATLAPNLRASGQGRASFRIDAPLEGGVGAGAGAALAALSGDVDASFERIGLPGLMLSGARVQARLDRGIAEIARGTGALNGGPVVLTAQMDLLAPVPMVLGSLHARRVRVEGDLRHLVARAVPIFAGAGATVEAQVDADATFTARGTDLASLERTLRADCRVRSPGARVAGSPALARVLTELGVDPVLDIARLDTSFRVADGAVLHEMLAVGGPRVELRLSGVTTLGGRLDYRFGIKPRGGGSGGGRRNPRWNRYARIVDRSGFLPLTLGGTLTAPSLSLPEPGELLERALDGAADELLRKGVREGIDRLLGGKRKKKKHKKDS